MHEEEYAAGGTVRRRRRRRLSRLGYFLLFIILLACAAAVCTAFFFRVDTINVTGSTPYSASQVIAASGIGNGANLLHIDKTAAEKKIVSSLPFVASAKVNLSPPSTVKLALTADKPAFMLTDGVVYAYADKNLKALDTGPKNKYPGVTEVDGAEVVKFVPGTVLVLKDPSQGAEIEALLQAVSGSGLPDVNAFNVANIYDLSVVYQNRITVVVGANVDLEQKLEDAAAIIKTKMQPADRGSLDVSAQDKKFTFSPS